jgi:hypothetical protein
MNANQPSRSRRLVWLLLACVLLPSGAGAGQADPLLEEGFRAMYGLQFGVCEEKFAEYRKRNPDDGFGPAAEAACVLFEEFDRLRILDAELYTDDKKLFGESQQKPDPEIKKELTALTDRARQLADDTLKREPANTRALFARAMAYGLMADYTALAEKKYLAAAKLGKSGLEDANQLLKLDPAFYDAHIWPGVANYVAGSLAFPVRWLAKLRGFPTDKKAGIENLKQAADKGALLKPYAKILLVVVNLRSKDRPAARALLGELSAEFPTNSLFIKHARRLDAP